LYLASVIDLYSRRLIGFAIAEHGRAPLVLDALKMALATRRGLVGGVIMHTDRGSQYTAQAFTGLCARHGIVQSMSRSGSCLDNAPAEAFFATLKTELVYRIALPTRQQARQRLSRWLERYNRVRRHSHCGYQAPAVYEAQTAQCTSTRLARAA
jgi:transposase InsO family protein